MKTYIKRTIRRLLRLQKKINILSNWLKMLKKINKINLNLTLQLLRELLACKNSYFPK